MSNCANKSRSASTDLTTTTEIAIEGSPLERHYTVGEIAKAWNCSKDSVRRLFRDVPGVLVLGTDNPRKGKRRYTTLRVPASVLEQVHAQYSCGNNVLIR